MAVRRRPSMAKVALQLDELDQWLRDRTERKPAATNLSMLDGYVTGIVVGPVSFDPREWICPLLAIDEDAFNHGGTPEFAAISAVAVRDNYISYMLSTTPDRFEPIYRRKPNRHIDARPWCRGFYAAMQLRIMTTPDVEPHAKLPKVAFESCAVLAEGTRARLPAVARRLRDPATPPARAVLCCMITMFDKCQLAGASQAAIGRVDGRPLIDLSSHIQGRALAGAGCGSGEQPPQEGQCLGRMAAPRRLAP
jgi:uncharacterized protein